MGSICSLCLLNCGTTLAKHKHMKSKHNYIPKPFSNPRARKPKKPYPCDCGCAVIFTSRDKLLRHRGTLPDAVVYNCVDCDKGFPVLADLVRHRKDTCKCRPGATASRFPCPVEGCEYVGPSARGLMVHLASSVHVHVPAAIPCPEEGCPYMGRSSVHIKRHVRYVHETADDAFKCALCGTGCKDARSLREHGEWKHSDGALPHVCSVEGCEAKFAVAKALRQHELVTHGPKTFACTEPGCARRYGTAVCLRRHIATRHGPPKMVTCPICCVDIVSGSSFSNHLSRHGANYQYGKSKGEACMFRALEELGAPFATELLAGSTQMRYDFWVEWPTRTLTPTPTPSVIEVLIEVDGMYHFQVCRNGLVGQMNFLGQVQRDLEKSRLAAQSGCTLVRVTSTPHKESRTLEILQELIAAAQSLEGVFLSYVMPHSFQHDLAQALRSEVRRTEVKPPREERLLAMRAVAMTLDSIDLDDDGIEDLPESVADAVLALYLRQVATVEVARAHRVWNECVCLAAFMPEFSMMGTFVDAEGVSVGPNRLCVDNDVQVAFRGALDRQSLVISKKVSVAPVAAATAIDTSDSEDSMPLSSDALNTCWICDAACGSGNVGIDMMLGHVNSAHGSIAPVRCRFCPRVFTSHRHRKTGEHDKECTRKTSRSSDQKSSACGYEGCPFWASTYCHLMRHFNDAHGTKFPGGCTLRCTSCGFATPRDIFDKYHAHTCQC